MRVESSGLLCRDEQHRGERCDALAAPREAETLGGRRLDVHLTRTLRRRSAAMFGDHLAARAARASAPARPRSTSTLPSAYPAARACAIRGEAGRDCPRPCRPHRYPESAYRCRPRPARRGSRRTPRATARRRRSGRRARARKEWSRRRAPDGGRSTSACTSKPLPMRSAGAPIAHARGCRATRIASASATSSG